ncbi:MAG: zf-TFIIB domain-containing protein [Kineosporiaceae bacterium]
MSTLQCPKCHAAMNTYERNGVHVDQCTGCRGVFLDHGELEQLMRVEEQWVERAPAPAAAPPPPPAPAAQAGYPPPPPAGYPQQGYPQQGYPQQGYPPPAPPAGYGQPGWGSPYGHHGHHKKHSMFRMLFSS